MALTRANLSLVGTSGRSKVWTYDTPDAKATIVAADYFLAVTNELVPGDLIHVRAVTGGTEVHFDLSILVSNGTTVTCLSGANRA